MSFALLLVLLSHPTTPRRAPEPWHIELAPKVNSAKLRVEASTWKSAQREVSANKSRLEGGPETLQELRKSILKEGPETGKKIALTFDDGPHLKATDDLIKILKEEHVPATFFVVGFMAEKYPNLVRSIKAAGFEIGNHSYSHVTLTKLTTEEILTEYKANNDVIQRLTGAPARYCRPPGGDIDSEVVRNAAKLGMTTVLWTADPADYSNPKDDLLLDREVAKLDSGAIFLLHDGSKSTLATLREFIHVARKKGYKFVSLDEMRADTK
ncbi:MAG: polysaccharide deacetylase family protein [Armatimonadetes bacterium]|nr:polysaccharide deacetylase family protein [Armatimonadota bacterium]MBS1700922.1 polysaccharide deacetylase family protein [Armatimonadota bacterium]MBS1726559.1 polysaccharide deacetylase family protein [Armatimonadota bacterium]